MNTPLITVIVPVYNTEKYLPACAASVLDQTGSYELILMDDGSTDGSGALCDALAREHPDTVRVVHQPNAGLLMTRRHGLPHARGAYVMFLDADDCLAPEAISVLTELAERRDPDIVLYRWTRIREDGTPAGEEQPLLFPEGPVTRQELLTRMAETENLNSLCTKLVRRSLYDTDTDYTPYAAVTNGEDLLQSIPVVMAAERIEYCPRPLYLYRVNESSITNASRRGNALYLSPVRARLLAALEDSSLDTEENLAAFFFVCSQRLMALLSGAALGTEPGLEPLLRDLVDAPVVARMAPYVKGFPITRYLRLVLRTYLRGHLTAALGMLRFRSRVQRMLAP